MFTRGSKWFFGLGLLSLVLAWAYGWTTGGNGLGPLTVGYKGGVGDHFGYGVLLSTAVASIFLGLVAVATRDASPKALAELAGTDTAPSVAPPAAASYLPVLGAFAAVLVVLGLVLNSFVVLAGFVLAGIVTLWWAVLAWSDRATGDPEVNREVRTRLLGPIEVPLIGAVVIGASVWAFSRMLLTSSKLGAVWVATILGILVFAVGVLLAARPKLSKNVIAGLLALCAVGVLAGGIVTAARGERSIPHHEPHETELSPYTPEGTNRADTSADIAPTSPEAGH